MARNERRESERRGTRDVRGVAAHVVVLLRCIAQMKANCRTLAVKRQHRAVLQAAGAAGAASLARAVLFAEKFGGSVGQV